MTTIETIQPTDEILEKVELTDEEAQLKLGITDKFLRWCAKDTSAARFQRTVLQGLIGTVATVLPQMLTGFFFPEWVTALIVAASMAILSPIQSALGNEYTKKITTTTTNQ